MELNRTLNQAGRESEFVDPRTPWTVNNAALPAYPASFTPQPPFRTQGTRELPVSGQLGLCMTHPLVLACTIPTCHAH